MAKRIKEAAGTIGLLFIILLWGSGLGCSRSDAPQSQQTSTPVAQQAQPPAAPAPAPPAPAPASPAPPASPQYAAPSQPPVMQPQGVGPQNFTQIQLGMTSGQVRQLMGEPSRIKQEGQKIEWEYYSPQGKFEVKLFNDQVVSMENH